MVNKKSRFHYKLGFLLIAIYLFCIIIINLFWIVLINNTLTNFSKFNLLYTSNFSIYLVGVNIVFFVLVSIAVLLITRRIYLFIDQFEKASELIAKGDFNFSLNLKPQPMYETDIILDSFNSMIANVKNTFSMLEVQRKRSDQAAGLLLRRDLELRNTNEQLEKERETAIAERDKLSLVLSGVTDAVIALDTDGDIILFNQAAEKLFDTNLNAVYQKPIDTIISVFDKDGNGVPRDRYFKMPKSFSENSILILQNVKVVGSTGEVTYGNLISGTIKTGSEVNLGCILTFHDITKERELENMKLDFVSIAAHELRTPLTAIRGYISLLQKRLQANLPDEEKTFFNRINIASEQLAVLVENILNVSKIERGTFSINLTSTDWIVIVNQIISELKDRANEKNIQLNFADANKKDLMVNVDKVRIGEVLINLISNAISYTPNGGRIDIWLEQNDKEVITHVKDTGEGIPQSAMPNLFTKFFRVAGPLSQGSKGTGLGLYITKSIVELHKGRIWIESQVNKGSTFSFSLPK